MFMRLLVKILTYFHRRYSKSWAYISIAAFVYRTIKKMLIKRQVFTFPQSEPGNRFVVEHLPYTYAQRSKWRKKQAKLGKKNAKKLAKKARKDRKYL